MAIDIDNVEYLTPEEVCELLSIHPNTLDRWFIKTKNGLLDMPFIMNPEARSTKGGYYLRNGCRPNYLLPRLKFTEWLNKFGIYTNNNRLVDELKALTKAKHDDATDALAYSLLGNELLFFVLRSKTDGEIKRDAYGKIRKFYSQEAARNARSEYETWEDIEIVSSLNLTLKDYANDFELFKNHIEKLKDMGPGVEMIVNKPHDLHVDIPRQDVIDGLGVKAISSIVGKKFDEQMESFGKEHGFPVIFVFYNRKEEMDDDNVSRSTFTVQLFDKSMMRRAADFASMHEGELGVYYPNHLSYDAEYMQQFVMDNDLPLFCKNHKCTSRGPKCDKCAYTARGR